jgi:NAD(P)-dependent dehydrogenase (short-subunit alcohol dehydrogenase family)
MELKGSTFLVTGGASGPGRRDRESVVAGGGYAVIADLKEAEGAALAQELGQAVRFVRTDVTDEASGKAAVQAAVDGFGGLHGLVNCAGIVYGEKVVRQGRDRIRLRASYGRSTSISSARSTCFGLRWPRWRGMRPTPTASAA